MQSLSRMVSIIACRSFVLMAGLAILLTGLLQCSAQLPPPGPMGCTTECPTSGPYPNVSITTDSTYRYVSTSTCPQYPNPNWNNPNSACLTSTTYKIPLVPRLATRTISAGEILQSFRGIAYLTEDPAPILGAMGVFVNGVPLYGVGSPCGAGSDCPTDSTGAPSIWVDAIDSEGQTVDQCGGHPQQFGEYHIHSGIFLTNATKRRQCGLPADTDGEHSELLAWLFDGVALYGPNSLGGVLPTDLDECGGHTHAIDGVQTYHYHLPDPPAFPWTIGCFKACPEVSNNNGQFSFLETDESFGCTTGGGAVPTAFSVAVLLMVAFATFIG